jgi:hypothetical protein
MVKSSRIFATGTAIALAVLGAGYLWTAHHAKRASELSAACEAAKAAQPKPSGLFADLIPDPKCDPLAYRSANLPMDPETAAIEEERFAAASMDGWTAAAGAIFFLSLVPGLWYFFLRRLAELAAAVRGAAKP